MERLFVAIPLPDSIKQQLAMLNGGIPGAHWQTQAQMHLTLRFIGEVDGAAAADIRGALSVVKGELNDLELAGCGTFGPRGRERVLWVGVKRNVALTQLRDQIETALVREGMPPDGRKFHPHVTLARLKGAPKGRLSDFVAANSCFQSPLFPVDEFDLFSSFRSHNGAIYGVKASFPLRTLKPVTAEYVLDRAHITAAEQTRVDQQVPQIVDI